MYESIESKNQEMVDTISTLERISYQIAVLSRLKEELEARLCVMLEHGDEGQKSYIYDRWSITCKTGYNYSLNKEEYSIIGSRIPTCFNPVKEKISYELDKKIIKDAEKYASQEDLLLISSIIIKKPSKLYIKISPGV